MAKLTHFDDDGKAHMVDVGAKPQSKRTAVASGLVRMSKAALDEIQRGAAAKGDVLGVARLAGIMASKRTADLIPLCHPLGLDHVQIDLEANDALPGVYITATCVVTGRTGVEMEAMTAVSVCALTIYDMCKSVDRAMRIEGIRLVHKSGGKSGDYNAE